MSHHHSELESVIVIVIVFFGERDLFGIGHVLNLVSVAHARVESMHYAHL
jgi:hypothetical protein